MNSHPPPLPRTCPSCGSVLNPGTISCPSCGGVLAVEDMFGRLKRSIADQAFKLPDQPRTKLLLWLLAVTPVTIVPPLILIFLGFLLHQQSKEENQVTPTMILVAVCNIILSAIILRWAGGAIWAFLLHATPTSVAPVAPSGSI